VDTLWVDGDSFRLASVLGVGLLLVIGAGLAATVLQGLSGPPLGADLAFGVAALLYLVTEELLVEAHEVRENTVTTAMFFVGFLVLADGRCPGINQPSSAACGDPSLVSSRVVLGADQDPRWITAGSRIPGTGRL
jgi:hypothetical protein